MKLRELIEQLCKIEVQVGADAQVDLKQNYGDEGLQKVTWSKTVTSNASTDDPVGWTQTSGRVILES